MLFDTSDFATKKESRLSDLPAVPTVGWTKPTEFPDLTQAELIGFDVETKENDFDYGPGWGRGAGYIVGVGVAALWSDGRVFRAYYPVRHSVESGDNLDPRTVFSWLKVQLESSVPKVGANILYDVGWLTEENIWVRGPYHDVQFAEAIIDEYARVSLDHVSRKYLGVGKTADVVKEWIMKAYKPKVSEWRGCIWKTPPRLVGEYGQDDAALPIHILMRQRPILIAAGQWDLYRMECASVPMLIQMRRQGVQVDTKAAEQLDCKITAALPTFYNEVERISGIRINKVMSAQQLAMVFDRCEIPYPKAAKGGPSFKQEFLKAVEHPVAQVILDARQHEKIQSTFLRSYILDRHQADRIYCSFHPLKDDDNGAKTGRYSSSDPNLQNVSVRSKLGQQVRGLFIPDRGHFCWHKKDHSQIEYRIFSHYATDNGDGSAETMRERYRNNPATDYHQDTMDAVAPLMGFDISKMSKADIENFRKPIKNINFGLLYGQTEKSLAYKSGMSQASATTFFKAYHTGRPFVRWTMSQIQSAVQRDGYVQTLLGRRCHFNTWESNKYAYREDRGSHDYIARKYGADIQRSYAYRGVNYTFQGGAADVLKRGMLDCFQSGVFDYVGYPKLQVHDELDFSIVDDSAATLDALRYIDNSLEQAVKLKVPLKVDAASGPNWGACK